MKQVDRMSAGFVCVSTQTSGGLLWPQQQNFQSYTRLDICRGPGRFSGKGVGSREILRSVDS